MKHQCQTSVLVTAVGIVMVAASHPCYADLGDQLFKLLPNDGAINDKFGYSVAISGATGIVGAHWADGYRGSAYLFDTTTGFQVFKLVADDRMEFDKLGTSVAISGDTAIVGAPEHDDKGPKSGSAYLFDTTTGVQLAKLLADDGFNWDEFGYSVAISGATAIVGAPLDDDDGQYTGAAYLFDISDPENPVQTAKLVRTLGDFFGWSVAISGAIAIVGAIGDDDKGRDAGAAYLFDISDPENPVQTAKLLASDGAMSDFFGSSVAISADTAIIGAPRHDDNGGESGSAYLFDISNPANPVQTAKLLADDGFGGDEFGESVGISGTTAIVGAHFEDDNGNDNGSAYLFDTTTGDQIFKLLPDDGANSDEFGWSVAIDGGAAIVGAWLDDDNGLDSGSAYLFDAGGPTGTPATLTDLTMIDGVIISGGLPELASSDDMYLETEAIVTGKPSETQRMRMRVGATTTVQNTTTMDITLEAHITDIEAIVTIFLRNWNTGNLEQVGQFTNGFGVDTTNTINVANAARFVRNTDDRIELELKKIVILPFTPSGFHSLEDLLKILVR